MRTSMVSSARCMLMPSSPLRVWAGDCRVSVVFRKHAKHGDKRSGVDVDSAWRGSSSRTSSYNPRTGQGRDDGAIFVSSFLADTMQQEMSEALVPFGKYDRLVMRMLSSFLRAVKFSDRDSSS